jgi:type II secretory pathway component PulF
MRNRLDEAAWGRFAERLARLLDGGVPLLEALSFLESRGNGKERALTIGTLQRLQQGRLLSQALMAEEAPLIIRALVEVGEHNGDLAGSLFRSGEYCAERAKWRKESRQALIYPFLVCIVLLFVSLFLFQVVIPRFADLYAGMGLKMAGGTRLLIAFAAIAPRLMVAGLCASVALWLCWRYLGTPLHRIRMLVQRMPGIRKWTVLDRTHEWASTLGLLLDGGLPLVQALEVQSQLPLRNGNRDICERVRERVVKGIALGDALQQETLDERLMLSVQVAEVTGDLSRSLLAVERELATARKTMMTTLLKALEPVLMIVAGGLVGVVALFMLWPMLDLLNSI